MIRILAVLQAMLLPAALAAAGDPEIVFDPRPDDVALQIRAASDARFVRLRICPGGKQRVLPYVRGSDGELGQRPSGTYSDRANERSILELMQARVTRILVHDYSEDWTDTAEVEAFLRQALSARPDATHSFVPTSAANPLSIHGIVATVEFESGSAGLLETACGLLCFEAADGLWWWAWIPDS